MIAQTELTGRTFSQGKHKPEITHEDPTNLEQMLKKQDQSLMTKQFMKKFKKEFKTYVFIFNVSYDNRKWQLRKRFTQFLEFANLMKKKFGRETPSLPIHKESQLTSSNIRYFVDFLLIFLRKTVDIGFDDEDVKSFLQILPEKYGIGIIYAELWLDKLSGGRHNQATCSRKFKELFCCCCRNWRHRYFTITDQCVFYTLSKKNSQIKEMLAFSNNFKVVYGVNLTGQILGFTIKSAYRNLELKAKNLYEFVMFLWAINTALKNSPYRQKNRYSSYATVRSSCYSKYYIDGQNYFSDACDQMLKAKKCIYITGWMLTPYLLLKRPRQLDDRSCRLDYVLESVAQKGVKVYIIIYMEPKIALNNDSEFVQYYLEELHRNIKVLRHPNYILVPFLWSHHQKMIIVDQKCAFMGGLDLCYGRWDTQKHYLYNHDNMWKGADFCNFRVSDIYRPRNFLISNLDIMTHARMPWHDITVQIRGQSVIDLARHFVQYWNFVSFQTKFNDRQLLIQAGHQPVLRKSTSLFWRKSPNPNQLLQKSISLKQEPVNQQTQQQEYYEHFLQPGLKKYIQNPRLSKLTLSRNLNLNQIRQYPKRILHYITEDEELNDHKEQRLMIHHYNQSKSKIGEQNHQILRSASMWSLGLQQESAQCSIYEAYQDLISNAKEFIYIENQFFICKKNVICSLLAQRIIKAHQLKQNFKVIIMMPLLPGFQGEVIQESAAVMRVQLFWEYETVCRGKNSLFSRLSSIPNPQKYLKILSLRNHGLLDKTPVTQILYIHSKLMIVDDTKVILGSANINDRSLLGDRDSEIGILIQEQNLIQIKGRKVSRSAHNLRCQLYMEHFNITAEQASDFHNQHIWNLISEKAENNTKIYREVFGCYPDNTMKTYKDILTVKLKAKVQNYQSLCNKIDGFVVEWPMQFLEKEDLGLKPSQKQFFVPEINFT